MGFVLLEKEGWPGMVQLSFIEREERSRTQADAARAYLEDTLEERDVPFPREAVKVEDRGDLAVAMIDYMYQEKEAPSHWRIWFLVDNTRALMAAYVSDPAHDLPHLAEASGIIADIEFIRPGGD